MFIMFLRNLKTRIQEMREARAERRGKLVIPVIEQLKRVISTQQDN